jgi:hypothetical protein
MVTINPKRKLWQWWEKNYSTMLNKMNDVEYAKLAYKQSTEKLNSIAWVANYPNDIPHVQGLAMASAHYLGLSTWKCWPKNY